jgi:hypothetical protein
MDVFEQLLTSSSSRGSVNPETLEYIGQKASNEYLEKRASLNKAIVKLAGQHPELNNEHIHRIAEFANNITFQQLFEQNKDKNVHFDIADPGVIIRDLRDGGTPAHSGKMLHNKADYFQAPIREEKQAEFGDLESGMNELMGREERAGSQGQGEAVPQVDYQKLASAGLDPSWQGSANPVNDVFAEHKRLERAKEELSAAYETADLMYKQAQADFYRIVKGEVTAPDGAGLGLISAAFEKVAGAKIAEQELTPVVQRLMTDGVSGDALTAQLRKTAGKVLNLEHPLVSCSAGLIKAAHERKIAHSALLDLEKGLEATTAFFKQAAKK